MGEWLIDLLTGALPGQGLFIGSAVLLALLLFGPWKKGKKK